MINELKKIIKSEIKKETKPSLYKKKIFTNESKITTVTPGKLSY